MAHAIPRHEALALYDQVKRQCSTREGLLFLRSGAFIAPSDLMFIVEATLDAVADVRPTEVAA